MTPSEQTTLEVIQGDIAGIHAEFQKLNGTVKQLHTEVYGNDEMREKGIKQEVEELHELRIGAKAVLAFIATVGISNIIILITLWQHLGGPT